MQTGDSLRVSNACEMVQISTRLSRFFRWAWPPASENGAATTMDENKPLAGEVCNGVQVADKILFAYYDVCVSAASRCWDSCKSRFQANDFDFCKNAIASHKWSEITPAYCFPDSDLLERFFGYPH
jgi:hypothetical protein